MRLEIKRPAHRRTVAGRNCLQQINAGLATRHHHTSESMMIAQDISYEPSTSKGNVDETTALAGSEVSQHGEQESLARVRGALVAACAMADAIGARRMRMQALDALAALKGLAA